MRNHLRCTHENIKNKNIVDLQSPVFEALVNNLRSNHRFKQIKRISTAMTTLFIESFHYVAILCKTKIF